MSLLLGPEEKMLLEEALQVYLQVVSRQLPPQQVQQIAAIAKNVLKKLESAQSGGGKGGDRPAGISDEWYKNVCRECDKLSPAGCTDKVTEKYPGKCDPILHYEREKILKNKK
ncbi:MAG: hypothetical protein PHC61_05720 [Chitinivibrionales bacterium]|nr:hypothetical protein [Chitinivibrionales bacterium]